MMDTLGKKLITATVGLAFLLHAGVSWAAEVDNTGSSRVEIGDEAAVYLGDRKITIGDAVRIAIESNYDILSGAYELAKLDSNFRMMQKKYSPFLIAEGKGEYQEFPESTATLSGSDQTTWAASVAVAKAFPTGTQLSFGLSHDKTSTTYLPLSFTIPGLGTVSMPPFGDPEYNRPVAFVSLKQELLQNGFGYKEQREQKQVANAAFMQKDVILYQLSLVVVKVVMDYWNVVLKNSAFENAKLQYKETKAVRDITAKNVNLGMSNTFELHYYNVLVAGAEAQMLVAEQEYKNAKRSFLRAINLNDDSVLEGPAVLVNQLPELDQDKALTIAYEKRADYLGAKRMHDNAVWEMEIARNLALPSLTAEASFNTMGQRANVGDAYSDMAGFEQIGYMGKLSLTYPLGDPVQKIKERNAGFALKQADIALDKYKRQIKDEVVQQIELIQNMYKLYTISEKAHTEAETFYKLMLNQLRRGRLNASTVKNGVDALAQTRQQELAALIQFNIMKLQFIVIKNELFETFGIDPDQYIPK